MGRPPRLGRIRKNEERKQQHMKKTRRADLQNARLKRWDTLHLCSLPIYDSQIFSQVDLSCLCKGMSVPQGWVNQSTPDEILLCQLQRNAVAAAQQPVVVTRSLSVKPNLTWSVHVHGQAVSVKLSSALKTFPTKLRAVSVLNKLLLLLSCLYVCTGNPDARYLHLADIREGKIVSGTTGTISAFTDAYFPVTLNGEVYSRTLRTSSCELLVHGLKCEACKSYRDVLRALHSRSDRTSVCDTSDHTAVSSHTNYRYLKPNQLRERMANIKGELDNQRQETARLKAKLQKVTEQEGVIIDQPLEQDLERILQENREHIKDQYPDNSFHRLFWDQQVHALKTKQQKQIRWHPMLIRWCLSMKLVSPAAYRALRSSGLLVLQSERTLRDYTHFIKARSGFQVEVDEMLCREAKLDSLPDYQKHVCLVFNEVKVKEDLVFDKHSGELVGFVNIGETNNDLLKFEEACTASTYKPKLATHILMFMVAGILSNLEFAYAQFPCTSITSDQLYSIVWEGVRRLESCGFKVLALTCDGASPNRKFFRLHRSEKGLVYKTTNPYANEDRPVYFISDPPHLIKTVRNCWANSFGHSRSRKMWVDGQYISWQHLVDLYYHHKGKDCPTARLSILTKLKVEHIKLTSYSKMRVDLAAQVFSKTVAEAFAYSGLLETRETEKFVRIFDKFFDLMNVRSLNECFLKRKPNVRPYRQSSDDRLKWLETDFLAYLEHWQQSVKAREDLSATEKTMSCISRETLEGLRITAKAFTGMTRYLLSQPGVHYVLSAKVSQDALESFFGKQRMRGGYSDNPTVNEFQYGTSSLRVQKSMALKPLRGNCK